MDSGCFKEGEGKEHKDQKKMCRGHCGKYMRSKIKTIWDVARRDEREAMKDIIGMEV